MTRKTTTGGNKPSSSTQPDTRPLTATEKQIRAVELRTTGMSFEQIADELDYANRSSAHRAYRAGVASLPELDDRPTMLQVESVRLDALLHAHWKAAMGGDVEATKAVLAVMARRARLLGLDAPTKTEHKVTSELDAEIEAMLAQMTELRDRQPG